MHSILHILGGYPVVGVIVVVLAGAALLFWDYVRLTGSSRLSSYLLRLKVAALSLTVLSAVLITARFAFVKGLF